MSDYIVQPVTLQKNDRHSGCVQHGVKRTKLEGERKEQDRSAGYEGSFSATQEQPVHQTTPFNNNCRCDGRDIPQNSRKFPPCNHQGSRLD